MALDDTLETRAIDGSTEGSTVTVSGIVPSVAAHNRAIVGLAVRVGTQPLVN